MVSRAVTAVVVAFALVVCAVAVVPDMDRDGVLDRWVLRILYTLGGGGPGIVPLIAQPRVWLSICPWLRRESWCRAAAVELPAKGCPTPWHLPVAAVTTYRRCRSRSARDPAAIRLPNPLQVVRTKLSSCPHPLGPLSCKRRAGGIARP